MNTDTMELMMLPGGLADPPEPIRVLPAHLQEAARSLIAFAKGDQKRRARNKRERQNRKAGRR